MKQAIFFFFFFIFFPVLSPAQLPDTSVFSKDSIPVMLPGSASDDTAHTNFLRDSVFPDLVSSNKLLNSGATPVAMVVKTRISQYNDDTFYLLAGLLMLLGFLRFFFSRYFSNLFRVFFNTSLRQSQLTDQLLQSKLPSLLFNLFFILCGGIYIYCLLKYYHRVDNQNKWLMYGLCTGGLGLICFLKFCTLKFTGWITANAGTSNTYIFIVFLINKIVGIFLLPFVILISFADLYIVNAAVIISLLLVGALLLMRFLRSYGLLQNQLNVSRFHFLLFIIGVELLPLFLIYKGLILLLTKNP